MAMGQKKIICKLKDFNQKLCCPLCSGYLVDAVTLLECMHPYCRSCILQYLGDTDNDKKCPQCEVPIPDGQLDSAFKPDKILQLIVYKMVPELYITELKRRKDFFHHQDKKRSKRSVKRLRETVLSNDFTSLGSVLHNSEELFSFSLEHLALESATVEYGGEKQPTQVQFEMGTTKMSKRYFRCAGKVRVSSLKTLLRHKLGLMGNGAAMVEIVHSNNILQDDLSLLDIAYVYLWDKKNPLRLFFQVNRLAKVQKTDDVMPSLTKETELLVQPERHPSVPPVLEPESDESELPDSSTLDDSQTPPKLDPQVDTAGIPDEPIPTLSPAPPSAPLRPLSPQEAPTMAEVRAPSGIFPKHVPGSFLRSPMPDIRVVPRREVTGIPPRLTEAKIERIQQPVIMSAPAAHSSAKKPTVEVRPEVRKKVATVRPKEPPVGPRPDHGAGTSAGAGPKLPAAGVANDVWRFCVPPAGQFLRPVYHAAACSPFAFAVGAQPGAMFPQTPLNSGGVYVAIYNPSAAYPYRPSLNLPTPSPSGLNASTSRASAEPPSTPPTQPTPSPTPTNTTPPRPPKRHIVPVSVSESPKPGSSQNEGHPSAAPKMAHPPPKEPESSSKELATGSKKRKLMSPVKRESTDAGTSHQIKMERPLVIDESPPPSAAAKPAVDTFPFLMKLAGSSQKK